MITFGLSELDLIRKFTRQHFNDLARFSFFRIAPTLKNFTTWFLLEVYPFLKENRVYPIMSRSTLIGYIVVDTSCNSVYDLEEKIASIRSIYVSPEHRSNINIYRTLLSLKELFKKEGYCKVHVNTSNVNSNVIRLVKHLGNASEIGIQFELSID